MRRHHSPRYLGNLLVIGFNVTYLVHRLADPRLQNRHLDTRVPVFDRPSIFTFAVLLTIVLLVAVLSESVLATMVTYGIMITGLIVAQKPTIERLLTSEWSRNVVRALYYAAEGQDLGNIGRKLVIGVPIRLPPIWSSALFGAVMLAAGLFFFSRRNY